MIIDFCNETNADDQAVAAIMARMGEGRTHVFAAENGKLCGILGYCMAGEAGIADFFYVMPENRGGVVGGILLNMVIKHIKSVGGNKAVAIVAEDRMPLYIKIGFKQKDFPFKGNFYLLEKEI